MYKNWFNAQQDRLMLLDCSLVKFCFSAFNRPPTLAHFSKNYLLRKTHEAYPCIGDLSFCAACLFYFI